MSLDEWKKNEYTFLFNEKDVQQLEKKKASSLEEKAQKILNGHIQYFSHQWIDLGLNYDWITNPDTNFKYNINIHWSKINLESQCTKRI
jgi:lipopolysaccharide biosynthesis glycosyltransferase